MPDGPDRAGGDVARNTLLKLGAHATRVFSLAFLILAGRMLGPEEFGRLTVGYALAALFGAALDLGMHPVLVQAMVREPERITTHWMAAATLKLGLLAPAGLALGAAPLVLSLAPRTAATVWLLGLAVAFQAFTEISVSAFAAAGRFDLDVALRLVEKTLLFGLGGLVLALGGGVVAVAAMFAVSSAVATIGSVILVDRLLPRAPRVLLPARARDLARRIGAVAGAALCDLARARLVAPFVFVLAGEAAAGYFGAAQRLFDLLLVVPASLVTAAYPELARSGPGDPAFRRLVRQVVEVLVVLGLAVALTLHAGAAALTRLVFGAAYAPAAPLLGLLGVAAILAFVNYFLSSVLLALERPRALVTLSAIALVSALVLTPALVGPFGAVGGIGVLIALEMISLGLGLGVLVPMVGSPFGRDTVKILAVAAAAALAATLAFHPGHLRTGLALLLYLAGLALVRPACLTLGLAIVTRASRYRPARMR